MIAFPVMDRVAEFLDSFPDVSQLQDLQEARTQVSEMITLLDSAEPKNENSDAYELWADRHEELEDLLDEILDALE